MDMVALLNTITAALLVGAGKLLLDVRTMCAVHAQQLEHHHERLEKLEDRRCPWHTRSAVR